MEEVLSGALFPGIPRRRQRALLRPRLAGDVAEEATAVFENDFEGAAYSGVADAAPIPEPSTALLMSLGLAMLVRQGRSRRALG